MDIQLIGEMLVRAKPYRISPRQTEILRKDIRRLLELGVIEAGQPDFMSPMILIEVPEKDPRPYRRLNAKTRVEFSHFPI